LANHRGVLEIMFRRDETVETFPFGLSNEPNRDGVEEPGLGRKPSS
jgi:hypothetical protein